MFMSSAWTQQLLFQNSGQTDVWDFGNQCLILYPSHAAMNRTSEFVSEQKGTFNTADDCSS